MANRMENCIKTQENYSLSTTKIIYRKTKYMYIKTKLLILKKRKINAEYVQMEPPVVEGPFSAIKGYSTSMNYFTKD